MKEKANVEIRSIWVIVTLLFAVFLVYPVVLIVIKSFQTDGGVSLLNYSEIFAGRDFLAILGHSFGCSSLSALVTTILAFFMAYTVNYTNIPDGYKRFIKNASVLPMLIPTITYGFAIIYSFGRQGLYTKLFGKQLFDIYGMNGLMIGYVIYTLPIAFMLIQNTMGFIDKKYIIVSKVMGDKPLTTFYVTTFRPLIGTLAIAFIQCFFLSFTDFGIPASVGGKMEVIAGVLYNQMLGSVPDFNKGSVVAILMLMPSIISIAVITYLERFNIRYSKVSQIELPKNKARDGICAAISTLILVIVFAIFLVIMIVPFVKMWPYNMTFTLDNLQSVFADASLTMVVRNSLIVAILTALFGTLMAYGSALVTTRSSLSGKAKQVIESVASVTNTIPGMVLGIAFMLAFTGTSLQNTFAIIICCNLIHMFATPYMMMKNTLSKMNASWENTAKLMGDSWIKTLVRVITPNALPSLVEVFSYYFINAMVTVSAVIFLAGARNMVITTKIKELQHFAKFNEIFVLSLLILLINLIAKLAFKLLAALLSTNTDMNKRRETMRLVKKATAFCLAFTLIVGTVLTGCSSHNAKNSADKDGKVVFYTNADDEAVDAMKDTLDQNGYQGKYIVQSFGTSELGGKLLAEGDKIEADLITMSSFYIESSENEHHMFKDLEFDTGALAEYPKYYTPITAQEGAIIYNKEVMKEEGLDIPKSIADLAKPEYKDMVSVTDIQGSSTAWLMIQALISQYGEDGAKDILKKIYANAGAHLEQSGSGPIKKVRAGEVAVGFGLRHQAVADEKNGLPIGYVDPTEGNFTLTESVAVIDKGKNTNPEAMKMAECIIKDGRKELMETYPIPLYQGEQEDAANKSGNPKAYPEKLTVDLLKKHQQLSEDCK